MFLDKVSCKAILILLGTAVVFLTARGRGGLPLGGFSAEAVLA
jgi:hypothetical protein